MLGSLKLALQPSNTITSHRKTSCIEMLGSLKYAALANHYAALRHAIYILRGFIAGGVIESGCGIDDGFELALAVDIEGIFDCRSVLYEEAVRFWSRNFGMNV